MGVEKPLLSVVVPIYFEEDTIQEFYSRTKSVLCSLEPDLQHEIIFINDGSSDGSLGILKQLINVDGSVRVISFSRNFGHQIAITAGIDNASGDAVVIIDGDLQDPPEVICSMVDKWREGFKVVYGIRSSRKGENRFKILTARLFYRLIAILSDIKLPLDSGDFRLMDRLVVEALKSIREENRYIRGLTTWVGFSQCGLEYQRDSRYAGETKFNLKRMIRFALDGVTSFSDKPLQISGKMGMMTTFLAFLAMIWLIIGRFFFPERTTAGWTSLLVVVLFLGGIQLISIGVLGEYIGRIYRETKQRPLYVVDSRFGFESARKSQATSSAGIVPGMDESKLPIRNTEMN